MYTFFQAVDKQTMINDIWDMNDILIMYTSPPPPPPPCNRQTYDYKLYIIYKGYIYVYSLFQVVDKRWQMIYDMYKDILMYTSFSPQAIDKRWQMRYNI